ncbi:MAG: sensor histidine kinase, partial [Gemmatimonadales bacterium]
QLAHRLHPATLDHGGLQLNLEQLVEEAAMLHGIRVHLETRLPMDSVGGEASLGLYRIAQEALRNVAKHAGVREAWLTAYRERGRIVLTIRDAGQGFDAETIHTAGLEQPRGLGLHTLRERARQLGGTAGFTSAEGRGTTVTVSVPWRERTP